MRVRCSVVAVAAAVVAAAAAAAIDAVSGTCQSDLGRWLGQGQQTAADVDYQQRVGMLSLSR